MLTPPSFPPSAVGAEKQVQDLADFAIAGEAEDAAYAAFVALPGRADALRAYCNENAGRRRAKTVGPKREGIRALAKNDPEATLVRRHLARADAAYWRVIVRHRLFLRRCAFRLQAQLAMTSEVDDLQSICEIGAYNAALRYDPTSMFRFATYAVHWIRARVREERDLPGGFHVNRNDTFDEGFFLESLSVPARDEAAESTLERLPGTSIDPIEALGHTDGLAVLKRAFTQLPEAQQRLLRRRMDGESLTDLGRERGCTKERIRQLETDAKNALRMRMRTMVSDVFPPPPARHQAIAPTTYPKQLRLRVLGYIDNDVPSLLIQKRTGLTEDDIRCILRIRASPTSKPSAAEGR